jgi:hypothetical protein
MTSLHFDCFVRYAAILSMATSLLAQQELQGESSSVLEPQAASAASSGQSITSFTLWDVTNHAAPVALRGYDPIREGATLDLSALPANLAITATTNPAKVGSVSFNYNGQAFHIENQITQPSFNGRGQVGLFFYPRSYSFAPLFTTLTATPWVHSNATGAVGLPLDLHINVKRGVPEVTFLQASDAAFNMLITEFYNANASRPDGSYWNYNWPHSAGGSSRTDWIADSGTYLLAFLYSLRTSENFNPVIIDAMTNLNEGGPDYAPCTTDPGTCIHSSDVTMWDSIAAMRELSVIGDVPIYAGCSVTALSRAVDNFNYLDAAPYNAGVGYAFGACPDINYQVPGGGPKLFKTIETDSNYIKAAILLSQYYAAHTNVTNHAALSQSYLKKAVTKYKAVKKIAADSTVGGIPALYSAFVFDDGQTCTQLPQRFFASVNGNMIWAGWQLASMVTDGTGPGYRSDALATAHAVVGHLSDPAGIFEDLESGCDVSEPLVEAMYLLAIDAVNPQVFARAWILTNAGEAAANIRTDGTYGRLFGGPPTSRADGASDLLSTAGGYALVMSAAALAPDDGAYSSPWVNATYTDVTAELAGVALNKHSLAESWPITVHFTGHGIALIGTRGEGNQPWDGHAKIFVDGTETVDKTGLWQAVGSANSVQPPPFSNDVLFAWQWPSGLPAASHIVSIYPGDYNPKEGCPYFHMVGYYVIP